MSSPAEQAQSPASEAASPKGTKSPTPGPASPAVVREASATPKSPTPVPTTPPGPPSPATVRASSAAPRSPTPVPTTPPGPPSPATVRASSAAPRSPTPVPTTPPGPPSPATVRASSAAPRSPTPVPTTPPGLPSPATVRASSAAPRSPTPAPTGQVMPDATGLLPGAHWAGQNLPEENADNDWDSTLGSDVASSTASIGSSILEYRTINGRTYHSDSISNTSYWGPNDQKQNELLDIFHHAMTIALDGDLYKAPITKDPKNVIDLGTGTGLWAIDFADQFPGCSVIGTDISLIQPIWVPTNLRFDIDDYNKEWTYKSNFFDFIHMRWLTGTVSDWNSLYKEAYRCCKPGGWIEHMDASGAVWCDDDTVEEDMAISQWGKIWQEAGRRLETPFDIIEKNTQEEGMKEAGFVNISKRTYPIPLSPWSKEKKWKDVGLYFYAVMTQDPEGAIQFIFGNVMGWTKEEISQYIAHLKAELKDLRIHGYFPYRVVYAQKPLDA